MFGERHARWQCFWCLCEARVCCRSCALSLQSTRAARACLVHAFLSCCVLCDSVQRHVRFDLQQRRPCGGMAGRAARPFPWPPRPPRHPPPAWIAATAERHREAREPPSAAAATAARWTAAASAYTRGQAVEERVPGTENMCEVAQFAARELVKLRKMLAVSPAAFEPPRHTVIIEGRPLQVRACAACAHQLRPPSSLRFFVQASPLHGCIWARTYGTPWSFRNDRHTASRRELCMWFAAFPPRAHAEPFAGTQ